MISVVLLRCGVEVVGWLRECLWILRRKLLGTFAKTADSGALGFLLELGSLLFPCVLYLRFHLTLGRQEAGRELLLVEQLHVGLQFICQFGNGSHLLACQLHT